MQGRAGAGRRRASGPALSIYVEKCAFFPSTRRNTKVEYIMLPLDFLHLAICVTYFTCRRKHLSFWNGISIYSRTFSECQNQRSLKKFPPDRNISTWKESATHRRAQIASNRHSINRNKSYVQMDACPGYLHTSLPAVLPDKISSPRMDARAAPRQLSMQYRAAGSFCIEI